MTALPDLSPDAYALPEAELARIVTPALAIHLDRVRSNARTVLALAGGSPDRWRPHVKTAKLPAVFAELARAGLRRFKCATTREARHLAATLDAEGVAGGDVLVAHSILGPGLAQLAALAREHPGTRVSVLCEAAELVGAIPPELGLFVDVNPGMDRSGVPVEDVAAILEVAREAGSRFRGVHWYEGHLHGGTLAERAAPARDGYGRALALLQELDRAGVPAPEIVTSGTPTFLHALAYEPFTELEGTAHRVSPGTVLYHDVRSAGQNGELGLEPAAVVLSRVVSHPRPGLVTCDAGSKSLAADAGDPCAIVAGHSELHARAPHEEHLTFETRWGDRGAGSTPARGSVLALVPRHVCPTVNLFERAILVENGAVVGVAPVSARSRDLLA